MNIVQIMGKCARRFKIGESARLPIEVLLNLALKTNSVNVLVSLVKAAHTIA